MNQQAFCLPRTGVVVIGRNEGDRLKRCLRSIPENLPVVYVDSGSTDDSVRFAKSMGFNVVLLDQDTNFTAARARNAGWHSLISQASDLEFIQFIDGDCELDCKWMSWAYEAMRLESELAAVFGRRRERFPDKSIYNKMCDDEWNTPLGIVGSCGGDVFFRLEALKAVCGYSCDLIAGEEPDLCLRLRRIGWQIRRIDAEMTLHDANILNFGSWWKRSKRGGYAYAEHVWRHGSGSDPHRRRKLISITFWSAGLPLIAVAAVLIATNWDCRVASHTAAVFAVIYLLQATRIAVKKMSAGASFRYGCMYGGVITLSKFAEFIGMMKCVSDNIFKRQKHLIEYKD